MSRIYFHSPSGTAELHGSERAWLGHLSSGPAQAAWALDGLHDFDRAAQIVSLVPEVDDGPHGANYLHTYMREAQRQSALNAAAISTDGLRAATNYDLEHRFVQALKTKLNVGGVELHVAGVQVHSRDIDLNTALVAGSDPVKLAAKIHGWCEVHCWVEGADRAWFADVIDQGLKAGLYRRGFYFSDIGGGRKWSNQGWEEVQALLRSRDDEPVVLSYSVCEQFPGYHVGDWMPAWPDGVPETWEGYDSLSDEQKREREQRQDDWYDLDEAEQWRISMEGLRRDRPWARIGPDTLAEVTFGIPVTVYDIFAPDRDARVRAAAELPLDVASALPEEETT